MSQKWLSVVGVGLEGIAGISDRARAAVLSAEVIIGGSRHLSMVGLPASAKRIAWETPLAKTIEGITARRGQRVVILATGDPMHYGIGVTLARHFTLVEMEVWPQPSAFSLAAARLGWPLSHCHCLTIHGRSLNQLHRYLQHGSRLLILSEDQTSPAAVAELLTRAGCGTSIITILGEMANGGGESLRLEVMAEQGHSSLSGVTIPDLNCLAVQIRRTEGHDLSLAAGLGDQNYETESRYQLLTKQPIRALVLALLAPQAGDCLWDIGAGSGSVGIEFLRLLLGSSGSGFGLSAPRAFAIEKDDERRAIIANNAARLGVPELTIIGGEADRVIDSLPDPTVVFIGGGLGRAGLVAKLWQRLASGGRMVATAVTLEGEESLRAAERQFGGELLRIAVTRAESLSPESRVWRPSLPVTLWHSKKQDSLV
ncbi:MAG: precorrin-6y C5,15-methyltransferase (decarboxylating) subunit CbiE [Candidatus Pacebacteria bacterium]|nr:precorrin-6y C5,15-methyltransferase (decarboxylating) subunit CbiE [Candidatus Paceibacterota bacterium]